MFSNYLTIAIRNLWRNKTFSFINIFGLSLGIAFTMLIGVFVYGELQVNSKLEDKERIYIVKSDWNPKEMGFYICVPPIVFQLLSKNYPSLIESFCREGEAFVNASKRENRFYEDVMLADSSLLTMFGFKLLHGNPKTALLEPYSAVLTKTGAMKYFNRTNVLNETIILETESEGKKPHKITGVLDDLPRNSITEFFDQLNFYKIYVPILKPKIYRPWDEDLSSWYKVYGYIGFVKLQKDVSKFEVEKALNELAKQHAPSEYQGKLKFRLEHINQFHFSKLDGILYKLVITISCIAFFILLMAIINFVNLSIGNSTNRLKEIALRKTFGGTKKQLIIQFLCEAIITTFISFIFSILIYDLLKPIFEQILDREFLSVYQFSLDFLAYVLISVFILGILTGLYPAFILSKYNIANAVKSKLSTIEGKIALRKVLIVVQISLAVATISIVLLVSRQITFLFSKDLGYNFRDVLVVKGFPRPQSDVFLDKILTLRNEFLRISGVENVSLSYPTPNGSLIGNSVFRTDKQSKNQGINIRSALIDENFFNVFEAKIIEGESFFPKNGQWQKGDVVINESAAKLLGIKNIKDGVKLRDDLSNELHPVKGIVRDFHFASLHEAMMPMVFVHVKEYNLYRNLCFKLNTKDKSKTILDIKEKYETFFPGSPFDNKFFEEEYKQLYKEDFKLQEAVILAALFSIIIVIIGIIGIISITTAKRKKEIGVRKVLGAGILNIVWLFIKDFLSILLFSNLVGFALAFAFAEKWLQSFAFKINLTQNSWIFLLSATILIFITIICISIQTIYNGIQNPVNSLKNE